MKLPVGTPLCKETAPPWGDEKRTTVHAKLSTVVLKMTVLPGPQKNFSGDK